ATAGQPPASPLPYAAGVALLALISLLAYWRLRRRRPAALEPTLAAHDLSSEDLARTRLNQAGSDFQAGGDYAPYYEAIGLTVRGYLSDRFGFAAFALTTRELQQAMVGRGLDRWQARLAGGLLGQCDAVLYAQYRPARERADADLTTAYEIVEMSRP